MTARARSRSVAAVLALACGVGGGVAVGAPAAKTGGKGKRAIASRSWTRGRAVPAARGLGGIRPPTVARKPPATTTGAVTVPVLAPTTTSGTTTGAPPTTTTTTPVPVLRSGAELKEYDVHLTRATLDAGSIEVTATNYGMDAHNLTLSRDGTVLARTPDIAPGDADTLTADVTPGTYELYCSLYGHEAAGMHATLVVK